MTSPVQNASFYADFGGLAELKREARAQSPDALRTAAQQFESLFTQMMLKSMREASFGDSLTGSETMDFYQGMFDQQLSVQLSQGEGLGLAEMLIQQLTRQGLAGTAETASSTSAAGVSAAAASDVAATSIDEAARTAFVQQMLPHAQRASKELGVDATTLIAHAALETGWGRSMPRAADGGSSNNLFGIKASRNWNGASVAAPTIEYQNGVAAQQSERFRAYDSTADCFENYVALLSGSSRYAAACDTGSNVAQFAAALQQGGYATDPSYASKLEAVAGTVTRLLDSVK